MALETTLSGVGGGDIATSSTYSGAVETNSDGLVTRSYQGGAEPTSTSSSAAATSSASGNVTIPSGASGTYEVAVAPVEGELRMVPFNVVVPNGEHLTFKFGSGNYTLVQSDQQVCNASTDKDALNTGNQGGGSEYRYKVPFDSLRTYFSSSDGSCEKGMFGLINAGISDKDNFGQAMSQMAANDTDFGKLYNDTRIATESFEKAWTWGDNIATSQIPDSSLRLAMENILYTRQFLAKNPSAIPTPTLDDTTTPTGTPDSGSGSSRLVHSNVFDRLSTTTTVLIFASLAIFSFA